MLRGTRKQIILIKDTKSGIFDEAYFVLKPNGGESLSDSDMISEANRIIEANTTSDRAISEQTSSGKKRKKAHRTPAFVLGTVCGALLYALFYAIFNFFVR